MIGVISYIQEKTGKRGPYWTIGLEDGPKGLIVREESIISTLVEGDAYELEVEKDGLYTTVTNATRQNASYEEDVKTAAKLQETATPTKEKPKKPATKPPTGTYHSEFMKKRTPEETEIIAKQAFAKSLIEAYARLWAAGKISFDDFLQFNNQILLDADVYIEWLEIGKEKEKEETKRKEKRRLGEEEYGGEIVDLIEKEVDHRWYKEK